MGALSVSYAGRTARPCGESTRPDLAVMGLTSSARALLATATLPEPDRGAIRGAGRPGALPPGLGRSSQLTAQRATAASSIVAPRPGSAGTARHPSESMDTGWARKKSRRCTVQPGGS